MKAFLWVFVIVCLAMNSAGCSSRQPSIAAQTPPELKRVSPNPCLDTVSMCESRDAIVFVHGIYGSTDTFKNSNTGFDWPKNIGSSIRGRPIDVFSLEYQNAMVAWAKDKNPSFDVVAREVKELLKPLRMKKYRSIGFITHSLGGNVISTYMVMLLTNPGHPQRSQVGYVINLATPTYGSQIADISSSLKDTLGMNDYLLESLKQDNLYLVMLEVFRSEENTKSLGNGCRPSNLYLAVENKTIGGVPIVLADSASGQREEDVRARLLGGRRVATGVRKFDRDHIAISKPDGVDDDVYKWVGDILNSEFVRLSEWDERVKDKPAKYRLCTLIPFHLES
ncbi:esterase/lipase family protein [Pseudomonas sp. RA_35y_Pfl2_P32]|uniref:esterase/lipase family protein n=1 Tax=Pseudomonas sp. RA_35y_Pfl2_P32 TaxID=3088705 RepID=UPI0030D8BED1